MSYGSMDGSTIQLLRMNQVDPEESDTDPNMLPLSYSNGNIADEEKRKSRASTSDPTAPTPSGPSDGDDASTMSSELTADFGLHQAAREGALDRVKETLEEMQSKGYDTLKFIDQLNGNSLSPLHLAARYNRATVVQYLLEAGAYVDICGEDNNTPLHLAAK